MTNWTSIAMPMGIVIMYNNVINFLSVGINDDSVHVLHIIEKYHLHGACMQRGKSATLHVARKMHDIGPYLRS